jgi:hypothetical protein
MISLTIFKEVIVDHKSGLDALGPGTEQSSLGTVKYMTTAL